MHLVTDKFISNHIYDKVKLSKLKTDSICCKHEACTCCCWVEKKQQLCHNGCVLIGNKKRKRWVMLSMYTSSTKYINWFIRSTAKYIFINWHLIIWSTKSHLIQTTRRLSTFFHNSYQISLAPSSNSIFIAERKK